jgi:hypothetical protein
MLRHTVRIGTLILLVAVTAPGCNEQSSADSGNSVAQQTPPPTQEVAPPPTPVATAPQETPLPTQVATAAKKAIAPKPKAPRLETLTIPAGTSIVASLVTPLTTETAKAGDSFTATTQEAILVDGKIAVPVGAQIHGVLRDVQASGRVKGRAAMTLAFQQLVAGGEAHPISAEPLVLQAESEKKGDITKIALGAGAGALIGGITGGKKGAAIGAGVGAGAGTAVVLATKGDEIVLSPGQALNVHTTAPTSIAVAGKY